MIGVFVGFLDALDFVEKAPKGETSRHNFARRVFYQPLQHFNQRRLRARVLMNLRGNPQGPERRYLIRRKQIKYRLRVVVSVRLDVRRSGGRAQLHIKALNTYFVEQRRGLGILLPRDELRAKLPEQSRAKWRMGRSAVTTECGRTVDIASREREIHRNTNSLSREVWMHIGKERLGLFIQLQPNGDIRCSESILWRLIRVIKELDP